MLSLPYNIVLGSQSPRRREILKNAGFDFRVLDIDYEEVMPEQPFLISDIPLYLAEQKAIHAKGLHSDDLLITADTLVFYGDNVIGKPKNRDEAFETLQMLSGNMHEVISGVCISYNGKKELISDTSKVYFKVFDLKELEYYIDHFNVYDKAGAYGAKDWIGLIGIERIEGSYFNVMGLPMHKVFESLKKIENELQSPLRETSEGK
jgi:septum formation protein